MFNWTKVIVQWYNIDNITLNVSVDQVDSNLSIYLYTYKTIYLSIYLKPPDDAFRAGLRKLGPKINIPEVFLTRKAKKKKNL